VRATKVNAGLAESNGRLLLGIWRDSLHVTCGLTACTPGPTLGNEYGKTLLYFKEARCENRNKIRMGIRVAIISQKKNKNKKNVAGHLYRRFFYARDAARNSVGNAPRRDADNTEPGNVWQWHAFVFDSSVLFFSRPRSEGWPHHGRTFSIYPCPLSFWLTLPRGILSTSWCCPSRPCVVFLACVHLALFLALSLFVR